MIRRDHCLLFTMHSHSDLITTTMNAKPKAPRPNPITIVKSVTKSSWVFIINPPFMMLDP